MITCVRRILPSLQLGTMEKLVQIFRIRAEVPRIPCRAGNRALKGPETTSSWPKGLGNLVELCRAG
jgi:hypothetical protein